jgi:peptidoglycan/xylan/chitin deacetylase (PgdA/CDA1 family)
MNAIRETVKKYIGNVQMTRKFKIILTTTIVVLVAVVASTMALVGRSSPASSTLSSNTGKGNPTTNENKSAPPIDGKKATIYAKCKDNGMIAMTFDDGPSTNIPKLLPALDTLGIKATFFVNANNIANFTLASLPAAKLLKQLDDAGHQVGSHTFSHADMANLTTVQQWEQMNKNDEAIAQIIGKKPLHFRAPYLSYSDSMLQALGSWGYTVVGVNLDTKDYTFKTRILQSIHRTVDTTLNRADPKTTSFISLNHDFVTDTVLWVNDYVKTMTAKGFKFVTTSECLGSSAYRT